jgi:hypothetical protein
MVPSTDDKIRENRLRQMAARQGLRVEKSRRRDPRALDYGVFWLIEDRTNVLVCGDLDLGTDLDEIEAYLLGEDR